MALEHQNISISEASAAAAGATAQAAWRDALLDHASGAWTLVEEFDSAGTTHHWVVVKNDHLISGQAVDFYVAIGREIATGIMGCMVGEEYTAGSNTLGKVAPLSAGNGYIFADGSYGGSSSTVGVTWVLAAALPDNFNTYPNFQKITPVATCRLFTSVEAEYAVLNLRDKSIYVGAMTDLIVPASGLVATPAIACCSLANNAIGEFGGITNHPIVAADGPMQVYTPHALLPIGSQYLSAICMQYQELVTALYGYPDRYQDGLVAASEIAGIMVASWQNTFAGNKAQVVGGKRCKFKGLRMTTGPLAAVKYDNIDVDGNKHVVVETYTSLTALNPYATFATPKDYATTVMPMLVMDTGIAA